MVDLKLQTFGMLHSHVFVRVGLHFGADNWRSLECVLAFEGSYYDAQVMMCWRNGRFDLAIQNVAVSWLNCDSSRIFFRFLWRVKGSSFLHGILLQSSQSSSLFRCQLTPQYVASKQAVKASTSVWQSILFSVALSNSESETIPQAPGIFRGQDEKGQMPHAEWRNSQLCIGIIENV